jgi:surface antigen
MQDKRQNFIKKIGLMSLMVMVSAALSGCGLYPLVDVDTQHELVTLASGNFYSNPYYTDPKLNWAAKNYVGQCTWYAYGRIQEAGMVTADILKTAVNRSGKNWLFLNNANTWDDDAKNADLVVDSKPRAGSLAIWESNHVAYVEHVNSDGSILVTESNYTPRVNRDIVVNQGGVRLRSGPSTKNPIVWKMPKFTVMKVVDGPKQVQGYTWFQLQGNGYTGWAARIGSGVVYNYTSISLLPSAPALGTPDKFIHFRPQLLTNGRFISSKPQRQTFTMTGSGYTPNGPIRRIIKYPNGAQQEISQTTADSNGKLSGWNWIPQCSDAIGDYKVWTIDVTSSLQSNTITQRVTKGC